MPFDFSAIKEASDAGETSTARSKRGEFRLVALPGGRTRLEGTTWYEIDMLPQSYWTLWSNDLIHRIHVRVLEHIKRNAEQTPRRARAA